MPKNSPASRSSFKARRKRRKKRKVKCVFLLVSLRLILLKRMHTVATADSNDLSGDAELNQLRASFKNPVYPAEEIAKAGNDFEKLLTFLAANGLSSKDWEWYYSDPE